MNRRDASALLLAVMSALGIALGAAASIFAYNTVNTALNMSSPVVVFLEPTSTASATLGPNRTSAVVTANLSTSSGLLVNPDFYYDADPWLCARSTTALSCYWLASHLDSSGGVVQIYGSLGVLTTAYAVVLQNFTVPIRTNTTLVSIRYLLESGGALNLLVYGIQWWNGTAWQTIGSNAAIINTGAAFTVYNATLTTNQDMVPGETYRFYAGVYVLTGFTGATVSFYLDWAMLNLTTTVGIFSGDLVRLNASQSVYARLYITRVSGQAAGLNASIWIENQTSRTTSIRIVNGTVDPNATSTGWILLNPPPSQIYTSGRIYMIANSTQTGGNLTLYCFLQYTNGAYHVFYPVVIRINT